jgi:peptidoglycan/xylan/chitin deacetylase (PgdA/CDA1 family)
LGLKKAKLAALRGAQSIGFSRVILNSAWRSKRLLIIGYHGIALKDEYRWRPALYMQPEVVRRRFEILRSHGCHVLPLGEALNRLYAGTLPPRSVVITVDDGPYDFYRIGFPLAREFGFPVTVYLTTYYLEFNRPVFDPMCSYLMWKGQGRPLELPELKTSSERELLLYARREGMNGAEKDRLLKRIADNLGIDYEGLCRERILTLMNASEVRQIADAGVDIQLHTHRHRAYRNRERWLREVDENATRIEGLTNRPAKHFCYPSGFYLPEYPEWLRAHGVESATTCEPGLASAASDVRRLPRLMDSNTLSEAEFTAWVTGVADWLPRRPFQMSNWPLAD